MKEDIHKSTSLRHFLHLVFQYWHGDERRKAYFLGLGFVGSLIVNMAMALLINRWSKDFFDALQQHRTICAARCLNDAIPLSENLRRKGRWRGNPRYFSEMLQKEVCTDR
jgi:ABC-type uncharacterized transport system fused permease/ATPase subunit